jgi:hypothetical protein
MCHSGGGAQISAAGRSGIGEKSAAIWMRTLGWGAAKRSGTGRVGRPSRGCRSTPPTPACWRAAPPASPRRNLRPRQLRNRRRDPRRLETFGGAAAASTDPATLARSTAPRPAAAARSTSTLRRPAAKKTTEKPAPAPAAVDPHQQLRRRLTARTSRWATAVRQRPLGSVFKRILPRAGMTRD